MNAGRALTVVLAVAIVGGFGWAYSELNRADDNTLIVLSLRDNPVGYMAEHVLRRKILSGALNGSDALFLALSLAYSEHFDSETAYSKADEILSYGVDIDAEKTDGDAPLITAIVLNWPEIVVYLLEHCADSGVMHRLGPDPIHHKSAIELARHWNIEYPERDYSRVVDALENQELTERCEESR